MIADTQKDPHTILIMPAYNEAENIGRVLIEVKQYLPEEADILVVNDCSGDTTGQIACQHGAIVLNLCSNLGYGGALQAGFKYATRHKYKIGLMIDGDGQHDPQYIPDLMQVVIDGSADIALGSRFLGQAEYNIPTIRRLGMKTLALLASFFCRQRFTDPTSGYQALNTNAMCFFADDNYPVDFPDADTVMMMKYNGFRLQEVPVRMRARLHGQSMHRPSRYLYYAFKMTLSIFIVLLRKASGLNYPVDHSER